MHIYYTISDNLMYVYIYYTLYVQVFPSVIVCNNLMCVYIVCIHIGFILIKSTLLQS